MALPATDTFTAADGTALTTYSANWTLNGGGFSIYSNALCNNGSGDYAAHWNADTFEDDQYASCKITVGSSYIGPAVRVASGSTKTYYGIYGGGSTAYMYVAVDGGWTQLGSTGSAWATNDVIRIEANGTTISSTKNGSATGMPGPVTNNSIASGYAGVTGYAGLDTTHRLDDWEGGNLGGAAADVSPALLRVRRHFLIDSWR